MSRTDPRPAEPSKSRPDPAHGAVIDSDGHEIPITESMIQDACKELDKQPVPPASPAAR